MERSRQLAKMLQPYPAVLKVEGSIKPEHQDLVRIRGGSYGEPEVSTILGVTANVHAVGEVERMIRFILWALSKAPGNSPVRSSVVPHPIFESDRGQPSLQTRRRHIFDPGNRTESLRVSGFSRRAGLWAWLV
jgi:hypothetical protein